MADKRRRLVPKMKKAHQQSKSALLSFDTLYIDGRVVRDQGLDGCDVKYVIVCT